MHSVTMNPATGEKLKEYHHLSESEIENKIKATHQQMMKWRFLSVEERARYCSQLAIILRQREKEYAKLITLEMGKPFKQSAAEVVKCAWLCEHYAKASVDYLKPVVIPTDVYKSEIHYEPLGVILGVMPWNYPFWQALRFAVPALMAGNAGLLKHAANVFGCAEALEQLFLDAGFPAYTFTNLLIGSDQVGAVIQHPDVAAVSLTGSERAGKMVAAEAGAVLKKTVLELGGSDPYLILEDADLDNAVECIIQSRLGNAGQSCISAKRILIEEAVYPAFTQKLLSRAQAFHCADPMQMDTMLGPMARKDLRDTLHQQVMQTVASGAKLLCGGIIPQGAGFYYPATVLGDVPLDSPANCEELFGPVICLFSVKNYKAAIEIANNSTFGLASGIFTRNIELGEQIAAQIQTGTVTINRQTISDPRLPFGGIKNSGYGRELGLQGIHEFTNLKTLCVIKP